MTGPSLIAIAAAIVLLLAAVSAFGMDPATLERDHALTFEVATPHTPWARPYALGKVRVLFFADGRGTNARECVELMERFPLEAKAVFRTNADDSAKPIWHGGALGERRMLDLLRQQWDCFVFLGISLAEVPAEQKTLIVDAVKRGCGVVFVGASGGSLPSMQKLPPVPFLDPADTRAAFAVGQGRGVELPPRPQIEYYEGWESDYDYWQERLGRALLWSAGKEPELKLDLTPSPRSNPTTLEASISGRPSTRLKMKLVLRSPGHPSVSLPDRVISSAGAFSITIPKLPEGDWHLDARLVNGNGAVETWGTAPFQVRSDRSVSSVSLERNWGEPGGAISGRIILSGRPRPRETLRVQLLDRRRRALVRKDFPVAQESVPFEFAVKEWLPMLVTVEAKLFVDGSEVSSSYQYFHVTKRKQGQFNFLMWGSPKGTLAPYVEENLAENGVTVQLDWENPPPQVGAFDISWVPFTTHISADKTPDGLMSRFCWNDQRAVKQQIDTLVSIHRPSRERGSFVYSIGDENKTMASCLSPYCADAYRTYLRESYGSLDALNRSWQTGFTNWSEVGLSSPGDDDEQTSQRTGNYPRWFDRQAYKSWNYVQFCLKHAKAYRAMDPQAKTGFDGAGGFATGDDLDLVIRSMGSWVPYAGISDEVIRSIATRDFVRSNWIGGRDRDAGPLLQKYWRLVTLGADSVWWWMWNYLGDNLSGFLAPDLRPYPEIAELVKDTREVREGLGDLLIRSEMQDDGIAVLYSYPSLFATQIEGGGAFGGYEKAHRDLTDFIRRSGFQYRYVTDRMLRLGEVDLSRYRMLFLPRAEALGEKEAEEIRRYVAGGGTVVADLRPGLYDDHVKSHRAGVLDDLFGIRRTGKKQGVPVELDHLIGTSTTADPAVVLKGGKAARRENNVPLAITRKVGKGKAILLNCGMEGLPALLPSLSRDQSFWGMQPVVRVLPSGGKGAFNVETTRWKNGDSEIFSVLKKGGDEEEVTVWVPPNSFAYDLRGGELHGPCNSFKTRLLPDRASFFLLTDKPLPDLELSVADKETHRGSVVRAVLTAPALRGLQAVMLRVKAGERYLPWHDKVLLAGAQPVQVDLPIAYNDPKGEYRIVLKELFGGKETEYRLLVKP